MKTQIIEKKLNRFIKTAKFDDYTFPQNHKLHLSKGCQYMKTEYDLSWFFDTILFFQLSKINPFDSIQRWTLSWANEGGMIISYFNKDKQQRLGRCPVPPNFPFKDFEVVVNVGHVALVSEIDYGT